MRLSDEALAAAAARAREWPAGMSDAVWLVDGKAVTTTPNSGSVEAARQWEREHG